MEKVLLNTLPKSGTHLVAKLLDNVGYNYKAPFISSTLLTGKFSMVKRVLRSSCLSLNKVEIGLDLILSINRNWLESKVKNLKEKEYMKGHTCYSDNLYEILKKNDIKILQLIRDPRDVLVSAAHYIPKNSSHYLNRYFKDLSFDEQLQFLLKGGKVDNIYIESFFRTLYMIDEWIDKPNVLTIKFEEIIGQKGGGTIESQESNIKKICEFLNINIQEINMEQLIKNLYGGSHTFRKGKIGTWEEEVNDEMKKLINKNLNFFIKKWGYQ